MKKLKLFGIGNCEDFNYYVIEKSQEAIEKLSKIISATLGKKLDIYHDPEEEKDYKWKKRNFEKIKDVHEVLDFGPDSKNMVNIFYGDKKIFLTIHCSQKTREKFNKALGKISKMSYPQK